MAHRGIWGKPARRPSGAIGRVVCASPEYFAARGSPSTPGDLSRHDCIAFEGRYSSTNWGFRDRQFEVSVQVRPRLVVNAAARLRAALGRLPELLGRAPPGH